MSAKYDFTSKTYSPWVFRKLRENYFHLGSSIHLISLAAKDILSELGSPNKSGSFFHPRDYRFIIKTIHHSEHSFLRPILRRYYECVKGNPHALLQGFMDYIRSSYLMGRRFIL
ncbi:hypothetical protein JAAARDRAFT_716000 [Jaapia argillacea MUCL 33604]|uniref:PIPK domain-containing protein n=1 Tax=Jaapia argillacea MUCL 33604 TaxID=933084 RepID=A0A067P334_9AGAM|nr:hypothetical protein JAAARDRAFT_716000 [Jaapia argillacea MUCL 33604]